jgi:hypothetical protein
MRHLRVLQVIAIATLSLSASFVANDPTNAAVEPCEGMGDVFQLDVPGTYAAFAISSSGSLLTEVRGSHGEMLATSDPTMADTAAVDAFSGLRFDIAPPQVFEVESSVIIHVKHDDLPYELFLVRVDGTGESTGLTVRPPVEQIVNESGSCLIGDLRETFEIHTEAVYSDAGARQIFLVGSPDHLVGH